VTGTMGLTEGYRRSTCIIDEYSLSHRERQVLWLVAQGKRNRDVADLLGISICTVKIHLANIFLKLGVSRRAEAVTEALAQGQLPASIKVSAA